MARRNRNVTLEELVTALAASNGHRGIAARSLGVSKAWVQELTCRYRARGHEFIGDRRGDFRNRAEYEPTREEILAACERIQASWTKRDRIMRTVCRVPPVTVMRADLEDDSRDGIW